MNRATYIGPIVELKGLAARVIASANSEFLTAQFEQELFRNGERLDQGWHLFEAKHWDVEADAIDKTPADPAPVDKPDPYSGEPPTGVHGGPSAAAQISPTEQTAATLAPK